MEFALSKVKEKLIRSLHTKKGREKSGKCLVEGEKVVETAGDAVEFTFGPEDTLEFNDLITTEAPQNVAAVAKIPQWTINDLSGTKTIVVLDGVQDPGNVGSILRLCLGFNGSLVLIESADVTSPKVIRSSVGAMFQVPWMKVNRENAPEFINGLGRRIYRLEKTDETKSFSELTIDDPIVLIAGSEGSGIHLDVHGTSVAIDHDERLESLNVGHALAIALHSRK